MNIVKNVFIIHLYNETILIILFSMEMFFFLILGCYNLVIPINYYYTMLIILINHYGNIECVRIIFSVCNIIIHCNY